LSSIAKVGLIGKGLRKNLTPFGLSKQKDEDAATEFGDPGQCWLGEQGEELQFGTYSTQFQVTISTRLSMF
jgi:hypothetical protein